MAPPVQRSARLRLAITGLAIVGLVAILVLGIIFFVSLFFKSNTFVAWTLLMWFLWLWVAIGVSVAIMLHPVRGSGITLEVLAWGAWFIALIFAFAGAGFTTVIWARCQFNTGSLDDAETVICSSGQRWLLWILLFAGIVLVLLAVIGFAIHFYDYFAPRLDSSIRGLIGIGANGDDEGAPAAAESEDSYRRGGLLMFGIGFVGIFGLLLALVATIVFLVTVGIKDITFVTWLYNPVYIPFWIAAAISTMMLFMPAGKSKGALEVGAIIAWIVAFAFSIAGVAIYGIIWDKCVFKKSGLTDGQKAICDNEQWLVWILFLFAVWNILHTALGAGIHIWDFLARRRPTLEGLIHSVTGRGGNGSENAGRRYGKKRSVQFRSASAGAKRVGRPLLNRKKW